jgi:hypothetical protein
MNFLQSHQELFMNVLRTFANVLWSYKLIIELLQMSYETLTNVLWNSYKCLMKLLQTSDDIIFHFFWNSYKPYIIFSWTSYKLLTIIL